MKISRKTNPLYYNRRHYNALHKNYTVDIPFYINQCRKYGGPVLELACGSGRVTIPIAKQGIEITGIDISSEMLITAVKSAADAGVKINFKKVDIRKFNFRKKFKTIIYPFNSIAHMYDLNSIAECFNRIKKHLLPNGRFIFDFFNTNVKLLTDEKPMRPVKRYFYKELVTGKKVVISENYSYDRKTQIKHIFRHFDIEGKKFVERLDMRIFFPQELDGLLFCHGFKIHNKYGNFDCSNFTSSSPRQVYICGLKK
jgi:2-polyprenyl-3-methyl-5-hydroxy-6-metoxy-1,4-benzoquinol methylase